VFGSGNFDGLFALDFQRGVRSIFNGFPKEDEEALSKRHFAGAVAEGLDW
jgi:hypothetical protein